MPGLFPYLSTTGSVLSSTTGDQLSIPGKEILVDTHVLLLGEDSIVILQAVLLEKGSITLESMSVNWILSTQTEDQFVPASLDV